MPASSGDINVVHEIRKIWEAQMILRNILLEVNEKELEGIVMEEVKLEEERNMEVKRGERRGLESKFEEGRRRREEAVEEAERAAVRGGIEAERQMKELRAIKEAKALKGLERRAQLDDEKSSILELCRLNAINARFRREDCKASERQLDVTSLQGGQDEGRVAAVTKSSLRSTEVNHKGSLSSSDGFRMKPKRSVSWKDFEDETEEKEKEEMIRKQKAAEEASRKAESERMTHEMKDVKVVLDEKKISLDKSKQEVKVEKVKEEKERIENLQRERLAKESNSVKLKSSLDSK